MMCFRDYQIVIYQYLFIRHFYSSEQSYIKIRDAYRWISNFPISAHMGLKLRKCSISLEIKCVKLHLTAVSVLDLLLHNRIEQCGTPPRPTCVQYPAPPLISYHVWVEMSD